VRARAIPLLSMYYQHHTTRQARSLTLLVRTTVISHLSSSHSRTCLKTAIHPNNRLRPFCHFDEVVLVTSSDKACYRGQHLLTWFVQAGLTVFCIDSSASTSLVKSCAFSTLCIVLYVTTLCISLSEEVKEF